MIRLLSDSHNSMSRLLVCFPSNVGLSQTNPKLHWLLNTEFDNQLLPIGRTPRKRRKAGSSSTSRRRSSRRAEVRTGGRPQICTGRATVRMTRTVRPLPLCPTFPALLCPLRPLTLRPPNLCPQKTGRLMRRWPFLSTPGTRCFLTVKSSAMYSVKVFKPV